jgi:hypothetical protein
VAALCRGSAVFPLYNTLPDTIKRALPFLLASICYHERWLRASLTAEHPLFTSPLYTSGALEWLRLRVSAGCYRYPHTGMTATSIPPQLSMSNEHAAVTTSSEEMKAQLLS